MYTYNTFCSTYVNHHENRIVWKVVLERKLLWFFTEADGFFKTQSVRKTKNIEAAKQRVYQFRKQRYREFKYRYLLYKNFHNFSDIFDEDTRSVIWDQLNESGFYLKQTKYADLSVSQCKEVYRIVKPYREMCEANQLSLK